MSAVVDERQATRMLVLSVIAAFMVFLDVTLVNVAFPAIAASFPHASVTGLSWVINAYNMTLAALLLPAGRLADRLGRKRLFLAGLSIFMAGSALCGIAISPATLVAARVVQATGGAVVIPTALALALPFFPGDRRMIATSGYAAASAAAAAAGPVVGGVIVDLAGWRAAFLVNLPLGLVILALRNVLVESAEDDTTGGADLFGGLLVALGVGALTLGIVKAPEWGWTSPRTLACDVVAAVAIAAFWWRMRRSAAPMLPPALLRVPTFRWGASALLVVAVPFYALLLCNVLFLTQVWGWSVLHAGLAVSPAPVLGALAARPGVKLANRVGAARVITAATLGMGAAALLYRSMPVAPALGSWLPAQALSGASLGIGLAALSDVTVRDLPADRLAVGSAVLACARQVGGVLGIAILVVVVGTPHSPLGLVAAYHRAYLLIAVGAAVSALVALGAPGPRGSAEPAADDEPDRQEPPAPAPHPSTVGADGGRRRVTLRTQELEVGPIRWLIREAGSGPTVLLLHGAVDTGDTWRSLATRLAADYHVIVPDMVGDGGSRGPASADLSVDAHVGYLQELLDALGVSRTIVVGHSYGGLVAMALALRQPDRCAALVVVAGAGLGRRIHPLVRTLGLRGIGPVLTIAGSERVQRHAGVVAQRSQVARSALDVAWRLRDPERRSAFLRMAGANVNLRGQRGGVVGATHALTCPVLVVWGERDVVLPVAHAEELRSTVGARVVIVPDAGHRPHLDEPRLVLTTIRDFLASSLPARPAHLQPQPMEA